MSNANTGKTVRHSFDSAKPPSASDASKARLAALQEADIDLGDLPESPADAEWTRPGIPFSTSHKRQVTLRLDVDVLDYFQHGDARYQTRINQVLRSYMLTHAVKR
ncbi:MAG: BrnA antitoxin family protein [Lysobacterales bacterium]